MPPFQAHRKRRLSRRLVRKGFPFRVCEHGDHASIGISLEAINETTKSCPLFLHNGRTKALMASVVGRCGRAFFNVSLHIDNLLATSYNVSQNAKQELEF